MTVNEFPAAVFAAEELGYAQVERDGLWPATQVSSGALETDLVGKTITGCHVQDLKLALAPALEIRGIAFVL